MRRVLKYMGLMMMVLPLLSNAQEKKFGVDWHGYVNYEMMWDSRQMVAARDGNVLLFPAAVKLDENGDDINAKSSLNMMTVNSRLQAKITGPDAFGAKTSGMISGDFFGTTNDKVSQLRLRQAFVKMNWDKTELLVGKTWHPLFVPACFPRVVSFGAAIPFGPLSRAAQVRLTHKMGDLKVMVAAMAQADFPSAGPAGASSIYLRNSAIPEVAAQLSYSKGGFFTALTATYLVLQPRTETATGYKTDEKIGGYNVNALAKYRFKDFTVNVSGLYGQNMTHLLMLGGYAVESVSDDAFQYETYTNVNTMSVWTDIYTNFKKVNFGLFAGYTSNEGSNEAATNVAYSRGANIDYAYRISPRVVFTSGKVNFGVEALYDGVAYGTPDANYQFENSEEVHGVRLMTSVKYSF